jgi:hypothetical protein
MATLGERLHLRKIHPVDPAPDSTTWMCLTGAGRIAGLQRYVPAQISLNIPAVPQDQPSIRLRAHLTTLQLGSNTPRPRRLGPLSNSTKPSIVRSISAWSNPGTSTQNSMHRPSLARLQIKPSWREAQHCCRSVLAMISTPVNSLIVSPLLPTRCSYRTGGILLAGRTQIGRFRSHLWPTSMDRL